LELGRAHRFFGARTPVRNCASPDADGHWLTASATNTPSRRASTANPYWPHRAPPGSGAVRYRNLRASLADLLTTLPAERRSHVRTAHVAFAA